MTGGLGLFVNTTSWKTSHVHLFKAIDYQCQGDKRKTEMTSPCFVCQRAVLTEDQLE